MIYIFVSFEIILSEDTSTKLKILIKSYSKYMSNYSLLIKQGSIALLSLATIFTTAKYQKLQAQETEENTTIEEITEGEEVVAGEEVTVRGEVEEVESGISFAIQQDGFLEGDEVLVINVSDRNLPTEPENLPLQVTGQVGTLVLADVEEEYGLILDPDIYVDYESQPVIFADYMVLAPEIEEVSEEPENYYGLEVALEGEIDEIRNAYSFTLAEDELFEGDDLLMINATGEAIPESEETVVVTGIVRPFIKAELERDYDLTWDLDVREEIEAEYSEKPVLVVDSIYPAAREDGLFE